MGTERVRRLPSYFSRRPLSPLDNSCDDGSRLVICLFLCVFPLSQLFPQASKRPEEAQRALESLAAGSRGALSLEAIGETLEKRRITAATLALPGPTPPGKRQAVLVVACLEGNLLYTTELVLEALKEVLRRRDEPKVEAALRRFTYYFIPQSNPDGAARQFQKPTWESPRNSHPDDADRDLRIDEDGPEDLDGDGEILFLRVPDPDGPLEMDPADSRLLRQAPPDHGSSARFRLFLEGIDNDKDGFLSEDPPGGVNIARNFAHDFAEREEGTGLYPSSERESKALLDFLIAHPNIEAALTYGGEDNLVNPPASRDGPPDRRGEARLWKRDADLYAQLSESYRQTTGQKGKPYSKRLGGSWHETLYFDFGLPSFSVSLFGGQAPALPGGAPAAAEGKPAAVLGSDEAAIERGWLEWNDRVLGGKGFAPWTPYLHPQLGMVHIGGWRPHVRSNPPTKDLVAMAPPQVEFLLLLASKLSRVVLDTARIKELGDGLFEVRARVANHGDFPTALAQGVYTARRSPLNVELSGEGLRFLGGEARRTLDFLEGRGASREFTWIVAGAKESRVTLEVRLRSLVLASARLLLSSTGTF